MRFVHTQYWDAHKRLRPHPESVELVHEDPDDFIMRTIATSQSFYEIELLEYAAACGPRGGCFIDVGANIGNHTVYFAKFLADTVIAVEPSPIAQRSLRRNLELNHLGNVILCPCAAGEVESEGEVLLFKRHSQNLGGTRVTTHHAIEDASDEVAVRSAVSVRPLDDIVRECQATAGSLDVTLLKADVEGMELSVLKGAHNVLSDHKPDVCVETWSDAQKLSIAQFLQNYGYSCKQEVPTGPPNCWFIHESKRQARREPSRIVRRLVDSWSRGRLRSLRRTVASAKR